VLDLPLVVALARGDIHGHAHVRGKKAREMCVGAEKEEEEGEAMNAMDDQARKDAMADADTLELCLRGIYHRGNMDTQVFGAKAGFLGASAIACASAGLDQLGRDQAREAARAAFRACPGLRG
jgi:hypothetical protein